MQGLKRTHFFFFFLMKGLSLEESLNSDWWKSHIPPEVRSMGVTAGWDSQELKGQALQVPRLQAPAKGDTGGKERKQEKQDERQAGAKVICPISQARTVSEKGRKRDQILWESQSWCTGEGVTGGLWVCQSVYCRYLRSGEKEEVAKLGHAGEVWWKALLFLTDVLAQVPEAPCRKMFTAASCVVTWARPSWGTSQQNTTQPRKRMKPMSSDENSTSLSEKCKVLKSVFSIFFVVLTNKICNILKSKIKKDKNKICRWRSLLGLERRIFWA